MFGIFTPSRPNYLGASQVAAPSALSGLLGLVSKIVGAPSAPPYIGGSQPASSQGLSLFGKVPSYVTPASASSGSSGEATASPDTVVKELPPKPEVIEVAGPSQIVLLINQPTTITIVMNPTPTQEPTNQSDL